LFACGRFSTVDGRTSSGGLPATVKNTLKSYASVGRHGAPTPVDRVGLLRVLAGQPTEWTLAAVAYLGVVDSFVELDPDFRAPES
jgi:hypothetical protein